MVTCGFTFNLSTERMFGVFFLEVFWFYCNSKDAFCTLLLTLKVFMVKTMIKKGKSLVSHFSVTYFS